MALVRLHKYISNCGYCARRHAELLIHAGLVKIDGKVFDQLGSKVDPDNQKVTINGDVITMPALVTIMLHKPTQFITSTNDTHDRLTVMDLLPKRMRDLGVVPVGRLDYETEGLLVLTNDGDLNQYLTHPKNECEKEYFVIGRGKLQVGQIKKLTNGTIFVDDYRVKKAVVINVLEVDGNTHLHMIIREGKKRQIRKMLEAVGSKVLYLQRIRIGQLELDEQELGSFRELTSADLKKLR